MLRSLITLKAMTYAPTGGIVAAPTTSLPECIGGVRNWDYRFCWLRDASLTLDAFMIGGYVDEARAFRDWLLRAVAGDPADLQIMYSIAGARRLTEFELDWLPGYEGSKPVRVGNAASGQFQLDVYGEVMASIYAAHTTGNEGNGGGLARHQGPVGVPRGRLAETRRRHLGGARRAPPLHALEGHGLGGLRSRGQGHCEFGVGGDEGQKMLAHLSALRERIHAEVCERGFNPRVGAFTQSYGASALDASVLVIPHYGFLPGTDPRMQGTVAAIEKELVRDGFVLRYGTEHGTDGLPGTEGAFLACSFWLADNYAFAGRIAEAEELFERLLALRNHLGLLSEEYDPKLQRLIGNFPQAFSHLALILTARIIESASQKRSLDEPMLGHGAAAFH